MWSTCIVGNVGRSLRASPTRPVLVMQGGEMTPDEVAHRSDPCRPEDAYCPDEDVVHATGSVSAGSVHWALHGDCEYAEVIGRADLDDVGLDLKLTC